MTSLIIAILILLGSYETGWTSRYDTGVMEHVASYHGLTPPCDGCMVAVVDCAMIGETLLIRPYGADEWIPVVVVDCARQDGSDGTRDWMLDNNILVELSYPLALQFGAINSIEIEVIWEW